VKIFYGRTKILCRNYLTPPFFVSFFTFRGNYPYCVTILRFYVLQVLGVFFHFFFFKSKTLGRENQKSLWKKRMAGNP
jgi:hypothetical protein